MDGLPRFILWVLTELLATQAWKFCSDTNFALGSSHLVFLLNKNQALTIAITTECNERYLTSSRW